MTDMSDEEWAELAKEAKKAQRSHAGHFAWETDRQVAEMGVALQLADELVADGLGFFNDLRHPGVGNDPPDCEAVLNSGEIIGIEITELVHSASAAAARACKPYNWHDWRQELIPKLDEIIRKKDRAVVEGGPYSEYVLLIHSDEPWLEIDRIRVNLAAHVFPATKLISRVYFLISYDPSTRRYPYFRLRIEGAEIG